MDRSARKNAGRKPQAFQQAVNSSWFKFTQLRPGPPLQLVLPHLDAAYNLARWLTRNEQDTQDVVQEAYLRAFRFFGAFRGGDARGWLMKIVRNTAYRPKRACSTQNKAKRANRIVFLQLVRDQEVEGSNPFAPTNSFETNNLHYTKMPMTSWLWTRRSKIQIHSPRPH